MLRIQNMTTSGHIVPDLNREVDAGEVVDLTTDEDVEVGRRLLLQGAEHQPDGTFKLAGYPWAEVLDTPSGGAAETSKSGRR